MNEDGNLPRGPKSPMSEVLIRSSPGGQQFPQSEVLILPRGPKSPMSEVLILSLAIPFGYHSNQLRMGQNIEVTDTVSSWGKV